MENTGCAGIGLSYAVVVIDNLKGLVHYVMSALSVYS